MASHESEGHGFGPILEDEHLKERSDDDEGHAEAHPSEIDDVADQPHLVKDAGAVLAVSYHVENRGEARLNSCRCKIFHLI